MQTNENYIPIQHLVDRIDNEYKSVAESIVSLQNDDGEKTNRLQKLADSRTKAFVELAEHYLPELSHQALSSAWTEVRSEIGELLLLKQDRCRSLRLQLSDVGSRRKMLEGEQAELRNQVEKARLDYCSKQGNVQKVLREDQEVVRCLADINRVDKEIELALSQLDIAKAEAEQKLPSYQASTLFQYLENRKYDTPHYSQRGLERRWDRWLAKLIDYKKSKQSFDFLSETPGQLSQLIDEKRDRYKSLLAKLEHVRSDALQKFGSTKQKRLHEKLSIQLRQLDNQLAIACQQETQIGAELCEIESIQGEYYFQAIEIYRSFLTKLDPEILRVYAQCTESPIDDQICARVRKIGDDIEAEDQRSKQQQSVLANLKMYKLSIWELGQRLRLHVQASAIADELIEAIPLDDYLDRLRNQTMTISEAWDAIRRSLVFRARIVDYSEPEADPAVDIIEAAFVAAASETAELTTADNFDPNRVTLASSNSDQWERDYPHFNGGFRVFAFCETRRDADSLCLFLEHHDIACFAHDPNRDGPFTLKQYGNVTEIVVMVKDWRLADANQLVADLQDIALAQRVCANCESVLQSGCHVCWNCLEPQS